MKHVSCVLFWVTSFITISLHTMCQSPINLHPQPRPFFHFSPHWPLHMVSTTQQSEKKLCRHPWFFSFLYSPPPPTSSLSVGPVGISSFQKVAQIYPLLSLSAIPPTWASIISPKQLQTLSLFHCCCYSWPSAVHSPHCSQRHLLKM